MYCNTSFEVSVSSLPAFPITTHNYRNPACKITNKAAKQPTHSVASPLVFGQLLSHSSRSKSPPPASSDGNSCPVCLGSNRLQSPAVVDSAHSNSHNNHNSSSGLFRQPQTQPLQQTTGEFGAFGAFGAFGQPQQPPVGGDFGALEQQAQQPQQQSSGFRVFGQQNHQNKSFGTSGVYLSINSPT
jgi:hypothetical protein